MIVERSLSRTQRDALAQLLANERVRRLTHRSAMHPTTRESLLARGLIGWGAPSSLLWLLKDPETYLFLTDEGRVVAYETEAMQR